MCLHVRAIKCLRVYAHVCVCVCVRVCVCACTYSIQQAAGLVQLAAVGRQLGLHAVLLTQQVGDQDAHQAAAAGARQHLALHLNTHTHTR